jgi:uncharacterized protein YdhG (YjbR/CyaY superfamily)
MKNMKAYKTVEEYIAAYPKTSQTLLKQMRTIIKKAAPKADETISYGIPTFKLGGKNLVHFGAFEKHIGFYPGPAGITAFKKELVGYTTTKGAIQLPLNKKLPLALVSKIVKFRVKQTTVVKKK